MIRPFFVIPAKAGIHGCCLTHGHSEWRETWIPAFAGMTVGFGEAA